MGCQTSTKGFEPLFELNALFPPLRNLDPFSYNKKWMPRLKRVTLHPVREILVRFMRTEVEAIAKDLEEALAAFDPLPRAGWVWKVRPM
jgi:hypothetical protein